MKNSLKDAGFTIIELLIVIVIISLLSLLVLTNFRNPKEDVYYARAQAEFTTMRKAIEIYRITYGFYPSDVDRNIPPGIEEWLATGEGDHWPDAPWPDSVYDYDAFISGGEPTYQISIRFCPIGQPQNCKFPKTDWAQDFDINSSVYYCIYGNCKSHPHQPLDHPGKCVNCDELEGAVLPGKNGLGNLALTSLLW